MKVVAAVSQQLGKWSCYQPPSLETEGDWGEWGVGGLTRHWGRGANVCTWRKDTLEASKMSWLQGRTKPVV